MIGSVKKLLENNDYDEEKVLEEFIDFDKKRKTYYQYYLKKHNGNKMKALESLTELYGIESAGVRKERIKALEEEYGELENE